MGDFDLDLKNGKVGSEHVTPASISGLVWCPPEWITVPVINCFTYHLCHHTEDNTCHVLATVCDCPPIDHGSLKDCVNGL